MDIKRLNDSLMNPNSTEDASKRIDSSEKLEELCQNYQQIDPYVKTVLIQSVIFLDDNKFDEISHSFHKFVELGLKDEDEWVQRTAQIFQNYPHMEIPDDFIIQGPLEEGGDYVDPFQIPDFTVPSVQQFNYDQKILMNPPSSTLKEPEISKPIEKPREVPIQRPPAPPQNLPTHPPQPLPGSLLNAPIPTPPPPSQQTSQLPSHKHSKVILPPAEVKKEKKDKKILPIMPPVNSQSKPPKVDQPKKDKKSKKIVPFH